MHATRTPSEWHHCGGNYFIDGFVYHLSHDCHKDIDHNIPTMYCRSSSSDDSINLLNRRRPTHGLHTLFLQKLGENGQQKYRAMFFYCSKGCIKKFRQLWLEQKNRHNTRQTCQTVVFPAFHYLFIPPWLFTIGVSWTTLMVGGFQSKALLGLLEEGTVPSAVRCDKIACYFDWS